MKRWFFILALLAGMLGIRAQEKTWTLEACIEYALQHYPKIVGARIDLETAREDLLQKRLDYLPQIGLSADQGFNLGNTFNVSTGVGQKESSFLSGRFYVRLEIFDGLAKYYRLHTGKQMLAARQRSLENIQWDLTIKIVKAYFNVLLDSARVHQLQNEVKNYKKQAEITQKLVAKGLKPQSELIQIQVEQKNMEIQFRQAVKQYRNDLLSLETAMNYPGRISRIADKLPQAGLPAGGEADWDKHPSVEELQYQVLAVKKHLKVLRSKLWPSLTLSYSLHTNYYHILGQPDLVFNQNTGTWEPYGPREQLRSNLLHFVGISLQIPIFDKYRNRLEIAKQKANIRKLEYRVEAQKNRLDKTYRQLWNEYVISRDNLKSLEENLQWMEKQLQADEKLWRKSMLSVFDYLQDRRQYSSIKMKYLQEKYTLAYKAYILQKITEEIGESK